MSRKRKYRQKKRQALARFSRGLAVRVRAGTKDPDFWDIPLGGWSGKVADVNETMHPPTYLIEWDQHTLDHMHPVYRVRCERDGLEFECIWLGEGDLEPFTGEPIPMEQPTQIVSRPLRKDNSDDRVRDIFALTSDDSLPSVTKESLRRYRRYLSTHLSFPFQACYRVETDPFTTTEHRVTVTSLFELDDDEEDVTCEVLIQGKTVRLPLVDLEPTVNLHNRQLIEDYSNWLWNEKEDRLDEEKSFALSTNETKLSGKGPLAVGALALLRPLITIGAASGLYGAVLGAAVASFTEAIVAIRTGTILLGLAGFFLGISFGRVFETVSRVRHARWMGGLLGLVFGVLLGGMSGALLFTFIGSSLGGLVGGIIGSKLQKSWIRVGCCLVGVMAGSAIQSWWQGAEQALTGMWQGGLIGSIMGPVLYFAICVIMVLFDWDQT